MKKHLLALVVAVLLVVSNAQAEIIYPRQSFSPEMGRIMFNHIDPKLSQLLTISEMMRRYATIGSRSDISNSLRNGLNERYLLLKSQYTTIADGASSIRPVMTQYLPWPGPVYRIISLTGWTTRIGDNLNEGKGEQFTVTLPYISSDKVGINTDLFGTTGIFLAETNLLTVESSRISVEVLAEVRKRIDKVNNSLNEVRAFLTREFDIFASLDGNPHFSNIYITGGEACETTEKLITTSGVFALLDVVLERLEELAQQSANGVLSNTQRMALEMEFRALVKHLHYGAIDAYAFGQSPLQGELNGSEIMRWSEENQRYEVMTINIKNLDPLHLEGLVILGSSKLRGNTIEESVQFSQETLSNIAATRSFIEEAKTELLKIKEFSC